MQANTKEKRNHLFKTILASFEICIIHKKGLVFFHTYSTSQIVLLQTWITYTLTAFYTTEILAIQKHHLQAEMFKNQWQQENPS